jgi:sulfite reductase (ferredoxin)
LFVHIDFPQVWVGGSPVLTRTGKVYKDKVKWGEMMDATMKTLLTQWRDERQPSESFGDFCDRVGVENLKTI